jgi:hypothetical protein
LLLDWWGWLVGKQAPGLPHLSFWDRLRLFRDIRHMHHLVITRSLTHAVAPERERIS